MTAGPSRPMPGQRFAFHNWDLTAAAEIFDDYEPSNEDLTRSTFRAGVAAFGAEASLEGQRPKQERPVFLFPWPLGVTGDPWNLALANGDLTSEFGLLARRSHTKLQVLRAAHLD